MGPKKSFRECSLPHPSHALRCPPAVWMIAGELYSPGSLQRERGLPPPAVSTIVVAWQLGNGAVS